MVRAVAEAVQHVPHGGEGRPGRGGHVVEPSLPGQFYERGRVVQYGLTWQEDTCHGRHPGRTERPAANQYRASRLLSAGAVRSLVLNGHTEDRSYCLHPMRIESWNCTLIASLIDNTE
ncbi:hypothetical protein SAV14893_075570 [Streptomyces avermitilis]|uniref:Uncharacterized protein n=1 Tax=Streptomyces avermitilis TaxID=33903 RepID=A0A4D4MHF1_STRAX|nr:hypothetical protein SAV14893_075570 [Streptomyces avermitilis]GDY71483.1 hypothetical protein SAV31267_009680 [Streptomyces avermitilis]